MWSSRLRVWRASAAGKLHLDSGVGLTRDFAQSPVRVVIVDDHRLFVDALALLLGHDERLEVIGTASDGPTAIDLAVDGGAEVAVIDVRMPEVDGIETAKRLRHRSPETRVILVTGLDDPTVAERAKEAGAAALLKKGALHDQLKEAILDAAASQQLTSS
jgi:DNA-binding NarL/FixJ family response regulator